MVTVAEAEKIILSQIRSYGTENVPFVTALGRVLAEDLKADRDMPPFDRVTVDGIAIQYKIFENGVRQFQIKGTQAAGENPIDIDNPGECVEIMTGAALPATTDTVIRYEDVEIKNGVATIVEEKIVRGQNIHFKGRDKKQNDIVGIANQFVTPVVISLAASIGKTEVLVKRLPSIAIITTGDELVEVHEQPSPYQIRRSNNYTIKAVLQQHGLHTDMYHITDNPEITKHEIQNCLEHYDIIMLSGGISMGKFDYVPQALKELSVTQLFHKVEQRPGKPFWFGSHPKGNLVFAFPGNPVSTFMCLHRYFLPWLEKSLGIIKKQRLYAILNADVTFKPALQYFLQVKLTMTEEGKILANPIEGNGSGDYANLLETDAFMELPLEQSNFKKGAVFPIWPFKQLNEIL